MSHNGTVLLHLLAACASSCVKVMQAEITYLILAYFRIFLLFLVVVVIVVVGVFFFSLGLCVYMCFVTGPIDCAPHASTSSVQFYFNM